MGQLYYQRYPSKSMTGKRQIDQFMRYLRYEKRYSPHTLVAYLGDLDQFRRYLLEQYQTEDWKSVELINIRSWVFEMAELKLERRTINRKISTLRSFYQFLKKEGIVGTNPVVSIRQIKIKKHLPEVIPEDVLKKYLQFSEEVSWKELRDHLLIGVLYETGMRRSELMELEWKDVDLKGKYIVVMGKRQKQRQIPIRQELSDHMKYFREATLAEFDALPVFVMVTDKGVKTYPKWIYNKVKNILGAWANSEFVSPHVLRHSIATHLLHAGADIQVIREFLGHSSLAATEIYTHNSIGKLKKAYKNALPDLDQIIH